VFALIAGLGLVTRGEVCDAFKMTAAGADGVLTKLLAAGLIVRRPGRAGGFCVVAADRRVAPRCSAEERLDAQAMSGVVELDAAMDDLDRLLAKSVHAELGVR
jgi:DNA-binding MarR family transcriptional regulator